MTMYIRRWERSYKITLDKLDIAMLFRTFYSEFCRSSGLFSQKLTARNQRYLFRNMTHWPFVSRDCFIIGTEIPIKINLVFIPMRVFIFVVVAMHLKLLIKYSIISSSLL